MLHLKSPILLDFFWRKTRGRIMTFYGQTYDLKYLSLETEHGTKTRGLTLTPVLCISLFH